MNILAIKREKCPKKWATRIYIITLLGKIGDAWKGIQTCVCVCCFCIFLTFFSDDWFFFLFTLESIHRKIGHINLMINFWIEKFFLLLSFFFSIFLKFVSKHPFSQKKKKPLTRHENDFWGFNNIFHSFKYLFQYYISFILPTQKKYGNETDEFLRDPLKLTWPITCVVATWKITINVFLFENERQILFQNDRSQYWREKEKRYGKSHSPLVPL